MRKRAKKKFWHIKRQILLKYISGDKKAIMVNLGQTAWLSDFMFQGIGKTRVKTKDMVLLW